MTRREARIFAFELIFESEYHGDDSESVYCKALELRDMKDSAFAKELFFDTMNNIKEVDSEIEKYAEKWKLGRMRKVTRAVLRLGVAEMLYTDVPPKVAINEAVEIAKAYDVDKASGYVNGILNKIARGHGLIKDMTTPRTE